jgi:hypothetical protein
MLALKFILMGLCGLYFGYTIAQEKYIKGHTAWKMYNQCLNAVGKKQGKTVENFVFCNNIVNEE